MSILQDLAGRSWLEWPIADVDSGGSSLASPATTAEVTPTSSRSHSPRPSTPLSSDDVMKLPKKDMPIFGLCPVQDDFVLVVCDYCGSNVKMEAFASHVKLRHGAKAASVSKSALAKVERNLRNFAVDVAKEPVEVKEPPAEEKEPSPVAFEPPPPAQPPAVVEKMEVEEIPDSTTSSNVISIPDSEPLPLDMSGDLMAIMGEPTVDSTTPTVGKSESPPPCPPPLPPPPAAPIAVKPIEIHPERSAKKGGGGGGRDGRKPFREYNPDKHCGVWDGEAKRHCTRALTCKSHSVLLKRKITGRSKHFDELVAAHKKAQAAVSAAAAAAAAVQPQPQSVTTPTVSVVVSATATAPPPSPIVAAPSPIVTPPTPQPPTATVIHPNIQINIPQRVNPGLRKVLASPKDVYADENLHYTTDHPKPLAVCTFGGRRIGGLLIADRSQFLTRKLVRVAIASNGGVARLGGQIGGPGAGFHRIRPRVAQGGLSLADQSIGLIKGGGVIKRTQGGNLARALQSPPSMCNAPDGSGGGGGFLLNYNSLSVKPSIGGVNLSTLQPGIHPAATVIPTESFKTDIQDFKGGIKFERGRKIKHILPSGGEIAQ